MLNLDCFEILLVDDDACFLEVSKQVLETDTNIKVDVATSVGAAFKKLKEKSYDAIVSDYDMPQKNGLEFLKELRENRNKIPFILFTGKGREEIAIKALNLGADGYYYKQGSPETVFGELSHGVYSAVEKNRAKQSLTESENKYRELVDCLPQMIFEMDMQANVIFANRKAFELTGYTREDFLQGFNALHLVSPRDKERAKENIKKVIAGTMHQSNEYTLIKKDGTLFPASITTVPIIKDGKTAGARGIITDLTECKKIEEVLQRSNTCLTEAQSLAHLGSWEWDIETNQELWSDEHFRIFGFEPQSFHPTYDNFLKALHPDDHQRVLNEVEQAMHGKKPYNVECRILRPNGETRYIRCQGKIYRDAQGKPIRMLGINLDITEQKRKETELQAERKKLETIAQSIGAGFVTVDRNYRILWANKFIHNYKGSIEGKFCYEAFHNLDHICPSCGVKRIFENEVDSESHEYASVSIKGNPYWVELITTPIKDSEENIVSAVEVAIDITEKKILQNKLSEYSHKLEELVEERTKQLEEAQAQLIKSERLSSIGQLAGMVGHDLRNPLTGIKNAAYYLKKKGPTIPETQAKEMYQVIDNCIEHANRIINDLLDYSKEIRLELQEHTPRKLLSDTLAMIRTPAKIKILNQTTDEPTVKVDADKIKRVFTNLINNAIDAMPDGGTMTISCERVNDSIEISFTDTGTGIAEEILPKIFTPLFTTKPQGMGFGLSICKRIIEAHGGKINVKSIICKGTKVVVNLPIAPKTNNIDN